MAMPLFNCVDYNKESNLYQSLQNFNFRDCYNIMQQLKKKDLQNYIEKVQNTPEDFLFIENKIRGFMDSLPELDKTINKQQAKNSAEYGVNLQFEFTYLILQLSNQKKINEIINVSGLDNIQDLSSKNILFLPFHIGPSYILPILIANYFKTATLYNSINFNQIINENFGYLKNNIEGIDINSSDFNVRKMLKVMKKKGSLTMFPEYNPNGIGNHFIDIPFFGKKIKVPTGPALISKITDATIVPVTIYSNKNGTFNLNFLDPISSPSSKTDVDKTTENLWDILKNELNQETYGEWEIWYDFDKILSK